MLNQSDILQAQLLIESLHHIQFNRNVNQSTGERKRRNLGAMAAMMSDVADHAEKEHVVPEERTKADESDENKRRVQYDKDRKREKKAKAKEKAAKEKERNRRRQRRRLQQLNGDSVENAELLRIELRMEDLTELYQEMMLRVEHIEYGIDSYESQITYFEDRLSEGTTESESHSESAWNEYMQLIWKHEEKVWRLKELRDDLFHHLWLIEDEYTALYAQKFKLQTQDSGSVVRHTHAHIRRRLIFGGIFDFFKKLLNALANAIKKIGQFIVKLGSLLVALAKFIGKLVMALINFLLNAIKINLIAFKADIGGLVNPEFKMQFAFKMRVFGLPIEFCISISLELIEDGAKDAGKKSTESHSKKELDAKNNEESNSADSKGNTHRNNVPTPAPLTKPNHNEELNDEVADKPRSGLPNLGLNLDKNWCDVYG